MGNETRETIEQAKVYVKGSITNPWISLWMLNMADTSSQGPRETVQSELCTWS